MRHIPIRRVAATVAATLAICVPVVSTALAADATGCSGMATSYAANGDVVDHVRAPGAGGTLDDPFGIDPAGSVAWEGSTRGVITDATWQVSVFGIRVRSGTFTNEDKLRSADGVQDVSALPSVVTMFLDGPVVVPVTATVTGTGGSCTVDGYISGIGAATGSPLFWTGAGVLLLATLLLIWLIVGTTATPSVGAPAAESLSGSEVTS